MDAMYTCSCADGRTITGNANWTPNALKQMTPLQLAAALSETKDFARYYTSHFFYPLQAIEAEKQNLLHRYTAARKVAVFMGIFAAVFTFLWAILAIIPALRFSGVTFGLAVLTFFSLLLLIPVLCHLLSAQQDYAKRSPRLNAKQDKLVQQQEKDIYGTHSDFLISGFLITPEYSLFDEGLELMIQALKSRKASNLTEAALLCRKKYPRSPVPRLITSLRSLSSAAEPEPQPQAAKPTITTMENQGPDLQVLLQLSEYLNTALKTYSATQKNTGPAEAAVGSLNYEEESMIAEFRFLSPEERKRIRRVIHSFYTKNS